MAIAPTGVVPPASAIPAQPVSAPTQNLNLTLPSLPAALSQALGGQNASLEAQIAGRNAAGQTVLTTPQGQFALQAALSWPTGSNVTLTLQNAGPPPVLGLALANQTGAGAAATAQGVAGQPAAPATQATNAQPAVLTGSSPGIATTATVLSTLPQGTQSGLPPAALPAQAQAQPTTAPAPAAPLPAAQGQSVAGHPGSGSANTAAQAGGTAQPTQLPAGTQLAVRLLSLAPPGQPLPSLSSSAGQPLLTGQVMDGAPQGQTLVATARGALSIPLSSPPAGTRVALEVTGMALPGSGASAPGPANHFPGLADALRSLTTGSAAGQVGTSSALANLQAAIPQPGPQMAAAMLFFMAVGRGGAGGKSWLGNTASEVLDGVKPGSLDALSRELGGVEGRARDSSGADWRLTSLPMMQDGRLEEIRLYRRPEDEKDDQDGKSADESRPIRFIVEAHFSNIGGVQLDTLTRPGHLDLMLRTLEPFDQETRDEIRALFAGTVSALGKTGELGFQHVKRFDVAPVEADDPDSTGETSA